MSRLGGPWATFFTVSATPGLIFGTFLDHFGVLEQSWDVFGSAQRPKSFFYRFWVDFGSPLGITLGTQITTFCKKIASERDVGPLFEDMFPEPGFVAIFEDLGAT